MNKEITATHKLDSPIAWHEWSKLSSLERRNLLRRAEDDLTPFVEAVRPVVEAVAAEGDRAIARYSLAYEGVDLLKSKGGFLVSEAEIAKARASLSPELLATLEFAAASIRRFHQHQLPERQWMVELEKGVWAGERATPLDRVGCYVPRGKGSFPSVALMTAIPAAVAGVKEVVMFTPPDRHGEADKATLVAAQLAGVHKIYKIGGAQAIAAAAYGTASVPKLPRLVGPGSPYVAAAKRLVVGVMDCGMPAGPSEVIIIAPPAASADLAALDLLIESEHGPDSSGFLVTWDRDLALAIAARLPQLWVNLGPERQDAVKTVLGGGHGGIVLFDTPSQAFDFVNEYAAEHVQILGPDPQQWLDKVHHAGEILLGDYTPGSIANYLLGPNCVLPTAGGAACFSPLSVMDFMKRTSIAQLNAEGYAKLAPHTYRYASYEGFDAHAQAVSSLRDRIVKSQQGDRK